MLKILITIGLLIVSNQTFAKSKCEREWNDLKSIQSQMRHRSTEYLRDEERDKHKEYQDCRKGKNKKPISHKTKTTYKTHKTTDTKNSHITYPDIKSYRTKTKYTNFNYSKNSLKKQKPRKNQFRGEKLEAWLSHFKTPQVCMAPKEMSQFAKCVSYRKEEKEKFNIEWTAKHNKNNLNVQGGIWKTDFKN